MPSITGELSQAEYRAVAAMSKSDLDYIHKSIALLEWARKSPCDGSHAANLGTALHCAVLEPERFRNEYLSRPEFGKTAQDKKLSEQWSLAAGDHEVLSADDYLKVIAMRDSIFAHPTAAHYLARGKAEQSIFWQLNGMALKCRPDWICDDNVIIDIKKIDDIRNLQRAIEEHRYYVQAAFYSDAYQALTGFMPRFIFVFVGERRDLGRHPVRVLELDQKWLTDGRVEYLSDLVLAQEYLDFGAGHDVEIISRPHWAKQR